MLVTTAFLVVLQTAAMQPGAPGAGAPDPAYARDGRLAVSVRGHLWIISRTGQWTQVTSGAGWDREPAWTSDGNAIVFSSDRGGRSAIWTVAIGPDVTGGEPRRITSSSLPEAEPAVAADGPVFFVRGRAGPA